MKHFTISIAGVPMDITCLFDSTPDFFRRYQIEDVPSYSIHVHPQELQREQELLNQEADQEGLRRRKFTEFFLERAVIQRKAAAILLEQNILLLHGSTVAIDGQGFLFTAKTGVGKSTHTRLWQQVFGDRAVMVNDDRAFLERAESGILAHGSPWSGKHGLDTNICVPLAGICILERGSENQISPLSPSDALPLLLKQSFLPQDSAFDQVSQLTTGLADCVPLWRMACTKSPEAAELAYNTMK